MQSIATITVAACFNSCQKCTQKCTLDSEQWLRCRISVDVDTGLMYFKLFKSAQLVDAYKEACRIVVSSVVISVKYRDSADK